MTVYIECPVCAAVVRLSGPRNQPRGCTAAVIWRHGCRASPCDASKKTEDHAAQLPRNDFLRKIHLKNRRADIARLSIGSLSGGRFSDVYDDTI